MKKRTRTALKHFFVLTLVVSLCMSMLTSVAMAQETQPDTPPANIELLLPASSDNNPVNSQPSRNEHDASLAPDTPESSANTSANGADDATQPEGSNPSQETPGTTDTDPSDDGDDVTDGIQDNDAQDNTQNGIQNSDAGSSDLHDSSDATDQNSEDAEKDEDEDEQKEPDETAQTPDTQPNLDTSATSDTLNPEMSADAQSESTEEIIYSDEGTTSDGLVWEMTKDATTGKYTLTIKFEKESEDAELAITEEQLKNIEKYAAEVSAALTAKYGSAWEWDSTAAPSNAENVQKFQVFLTGNGKKDHTYRYDAEKLEQMDGEFTLEKVDENGNTITNSEATFQLWHVNEIVDPDTSEKVEVKMFCSYDAETNTYTFIPTESTIQTINGRIEILYAMMKDTVYYLQEVKAPDGYEVDPSIHVVMEKDAWEAEDESFRDQFSYLGEFTEEEDGRIALDVKFTDVKKHAGSGNPGGTTIPINVPTSTPAPEQPDDPTTPDPGFTPTPGEPVEESIIQPEMPISKEEDTRVKPEDPTPAIPTADPEPASVNDIPKTGDLMNVYLITALVSIIGLGVVSFLGRRKQHQ